MGIKRIRELFDEKSEIAAWLNMLAGYGLLISGKLGQWPFIAMLALSLTTLLGAGYYGAKFKVGPSGIEIENE